MHVENHSCKAGEEVLGSFFKTLYESMPRRVAAVIEAGIPSISWTCVFSLTRLYLPPFFNGRSL